MRSAISIRRQIRTLNARLQRPQYQTAGGYMLGQVQALEWALGIGAPPEQMADFAIETARDAARRQRTEARKRR